MSRLRQFNPDLVTNTIFKDTDKSIINFGQCFIWAYSAYLIFADLKLCGVDCHAFVKHKGKFYDSDKPHGVRYWNDLPASKFSVDDYYSHHSVEEFKETWQGQLSRFATSWNQIESNAKKVLQQERALRKSFRVNSSYEESAKNAGTRRKGFKAEQGRP